MKIQSHRGETIHTLTMSQEELLVLRAALGSTTTTSLNSHVRGVPGMYGDTRVEHTTFEHVHTVIKGAFEAAR